MKNILITFGNILKTSALIIVGSQIMQRVDDIVFEDLGNTLNSMKNSKPPDISSLNIKSSPNVKQWLLNVCNCAGILNVYPRNDWQRL